MTESPAEELSPEAKLQAEFDKLKDAHLRLVAEYDNYRKRTLKEKSELIRSGGEKALTDLLPVVDDLEIALQNLDKATDLDALKEGVHLIYSKFVDYLSRQGVTAIPTEGESFDDELHEAIATFPAPEESLKGQDHRLRQEGLQAPRQGTTPLLCGRRSVRKGKTIYGRKERLL